MHFKNLGSYIAVGVLLFLITFSTVISVITNPIDSVIRLMIVGVIIFGVYKFVKFADNYADKQMEKSKDND